MLYRHPDGVKRGRLDPLPLRLWSVEIQTDDRRMNRAINVATQTIERAIEMVKQEHPGAWVVSAHHKGLVNLVDDL